MNDEKTRHKPYSVKVCECIPPEDDCLTLMAETYEQMLTFLSYIEEFYGFDDFFVIITRN